jgi:hypothetical protein
VLCTSEVLNETVSLPKGRVKVSGVIARYGIESASVYFQREDCRLQFRAQINDLRWLAPPSRLETQLLDREASICFAEVGCNWQAPVMEDGETGRGSDQRPSGHAGSCA